MVRLISFPHQLIVGILYQNYIDIQIFILDTVWHGRGTYKPSTNSMDHPSNTSVGCCSAWQLRTFFWWLEFYTFQGVSFKHLPRRYFSNLISKDSKQNSMDASFTTVWYRNNTVIYKAWLKDDRPSYINPTNMKDSCEEMAPQRTQ